MAAKKKKAPQPVPQPVTPEPTTSKGGANKRKAPTKTTARTVVQKQLATTSNDGQVPSIGGIEMTDENVALIQLFAAQQKKKAAEAAHNEGKSFNTVFAFHFNS